MHGVPLSFGNGLGDDEGNGDGDNSSVVNASVDRCEKIHCFRNETVSTRNVNKTSTRVHIKGKAGLQITN